MDFVGRNVVVVGAGRSGLAAARLLVKRGATLRVLDTNPAAAASASAAELVRQGVVFECGPHREGQASGAGLLVLSPGVPPGVIPVVEARRDDIEVVGEAELGARLAMGRLVGITGTNGKSTTTSLAARMLGAAQPRVNAGGNLGVPLCELLADGLDSSDTIHVLELSSFQCETLREALFEGVALLNLTPDHLDRYASLSAYAEAKLHLLDQQDERGIAVLPADDATLKAHASRARGRLAWFTLGPPPEEGVGMVGERAVSTISGREGDLFERADLWTEAPHHLANALAAAAVSLGLGATAEHVRAGLRGFRGLPHRGEEIATAAGPRFFNDSKATNVDSAVRSIEGTPRGTVVILGGRHKGGDVAPLRDVLLARGGRAVLIGEAAPIFRAALEGHVAVATAASLGEAVEVAARQAGTGGTVLLAPACASYDMFSNYEHRGNSFRDEVQARFGMPHGGGAPSQRRAAWH